MKNGVMIQYFEWYLTNTIGFARKVTQRICIRGVPYFFQMGKMGSKK